MATYEDVKSLDIRILGAKFGLKEAPQWPKELFGRLSSHASSPVYDVMGMPVIFTKELKVHNNYINGYVRIPEDTRKSIGNHKIEHKSGASYWDFRTGVFGVDTNHDGMENMSATELFSDALESIRNLLNRLGIGSKKRRFVMPSNMIDKVADFLEERGLLKEAYDLDVIANTLDKVAETED